MKNIDTFDDIINYMSQFTNLENIVLPSCSKPNEVKNDVEKQVKFAHMTSNNDMTYSRFDNPNETLA